jgi:hypothetical protein
MILQMEKVYVSPSGFRVVQYIALDVIINRLGILREA